MSENKGNKSLFLYTALIFFAAIVIVIISFFSQINLEKKHNEYVGEEAAKSISEKTAQLSEENLILLETTKNLNNQNTQLAEDKKELEEKISELEKVIKTNDELYRIFILTEDKKIDAAKEAFGKIDANTVSGGQKLFYEYLNKELNK